MLLFDYSRRVAVIIGVSLVFGLSACQVRPLHSQISSTASGVSTPSALKSVAVAEASTRYGQQVRNQIIFLISGGAAEPVNPTYTLDLGVTEQVISSVSFQVDEGKTGQPTAGGVVLTSLYVLKDSATGAVVSSGKRTVTASFDRPIQQFAALRAQREAEDRAARELAELIRLALTADLAG